MTSISGTFEDNADGRSSGGKLRQHFSELSSPNGDSHKPNEIKEHWNQKENAPQESHEVNVLMDSNSIHGKSKRKPAIPLHCYFTFSDPPVLGSPNRIQTTQTSQGN